MIHYYFRRLILITFISCFGALTYAQNFEVKIAIVDIQYVLQHSIAMQNIQKQIETISKKIEGNVTNKEIEFKKLEEDLIKKKNTLEEKEFEKQVNGFNQKVTNAQQDIQSKKIRLEQAHNSSVDKVHQVVISIINDLAKKYNVNLILPSSQVLYASPELNLTEEVQNKLNDKLKSVEVKY